VTLGLVNSHFVEVRNGLQEGDQVIYAGYEMLKEDDPVVPTEWGPSGPLTVPPATGEAKAAPGTVYTCPMHPEVKMDKPGDCPKCGMKLQPAKAGSAGQGGEKMPGMPMAPAGGPAPTAPAGQKGSYYCPMHKEVQSDRPGKCPRCGMDLVPKPGAAGSTNLDGARPGMLVVPPRSTRRAARSTQRKDGTGTKAPLSRFCRGCVLRTACCVREEERRA
jgi:hypothetical protein